MTINEKAIFYLENNEFERAKQAFQLAVNQSRDVQSLHNLAYYFRTLAFPNPTFGPSYVVKCYLFGCTRHGHPTYK